MPNSLQIGIIGAGPAGMMAALQAAWLGAQQVTLFDANAAVGRKLLVTGSGRCNLTNVAVAAERYACSDPAFLKEVFARFGREELLRALEKIGVLATPTLDGWYYPLSESAATVVDAFAAALDEAQVKIHLNSRVTGLRAERTGFVIESADTVWRGDRVIVAAGGQAYPTLGTRGDLYPLLAALGHTIRPVYPALAPILADMRALTALQGVRLDVTAQLWQKKTLLGEATGNLIFTQWGVNGPAAMDLSHLVSSRPGALLTLTLNFLPRDAEIRLRALLHQKRRAPVPLRALLGAALPPKLPPVILAQAGLKPDVRIDTLTDAALEEVIQRLTHLSLKVEGVRGFEYAQVSIGGVPVEEVIPGRLESMRVPGLYLAGETLDVVGPCGGFNLQYAFSSGAVAGCSAAQRNNDNKEA